MRRRLFFLLPDVDSARRTADDLLLARIDDRHMRFLARRGTRLGDLPEASVFHKTDLLHAACTGAALGGLGGVALGVALVLAPPGGVHLQAVVVLIAAVLGTLLGAWTASMAGAGVPNTRLKAFHGAIERGKVLLIVDVPVHRVAEVGELVSGRHPEAVPGGQATRYPAFP